MIVVDFFFFFLILKVNKEICTKYDCIIHYGTFKKLFVTLCKF